MSKRGLYHWGLSFRGLKWGYFERVSRSTVGENAQNNGGGIAPEDDVFCDLAFHDGIVDVESQFKGPNLALAASAAMLSTIPLRPR